jgi:hypothetical protein
MVCMSHSWFNTWDMFCVWGLFKTRQTTYIWVDVARL